MNEVSPPLAPKIKSYSSMAIIKAGFLHTAVKKLVTALKFCEHYLTSSFCKEPYFKSTVNPYQRYLQRIRTKILRKHSLHRRISSTKWKHNEMNVNFSGEGTKWERAFLININYHKIKTKIEVVTWLAKNLKHTHKKKSWDDNGTIELM